VTVLFADLAGWTARAETLDPEDARALVDRCWQRVGEIVDGYGGTIVSIEGDGMMAAFGAPVSHEDDPERAVRCALEMQHCATEQPEDFGRLAMRIGVNTGEVMFASVGGRQTLIGDTTNTGARLESSAPLGAVLVGEETYLATRHAVRYEAVDPLRLKGKERTVAAWIAVEVTAAAGHRPLSELTIVGRDAELGALRTSWERVVDERRPHLVTLIGPPGIGKTKLAREFVTSLQTDGARTAWGRSLPYGERAGYGAFGQLVKDVTGIYETDDGAVASSKLATRFEELVPGSPEELVTALGVLVGLETATGDIDKRTLFGSARAFVEGLGSHGPTVLVFEDLQWADASLLELVEWMAARVQDVPVLFLTLARPELLEVRQSWGGGLASYSAVPLGPLSATEVQVFASRLLAGTEDAEPIIEHLVRAAAGNPLFVEELAGWMSEPDRDPDRPMPTTVSAIIAARLDALPAKLRRVLLDASVIGETFWRGSLNAPDLGPAELDDALDALEAREIVRRERHSRIQDDEEYSFKHVLIREVAYNTVPKAARRERHRDAAIYLERASSGAATAVLAHHWREAGDHDRAVTYLVRTGDQAARGWAKSEAFELYGQAIALLDPDDERYADIRRRRAVARTMAMHAVLDAPTLRRRTAPR